MGFHDHPVMERVRRALGRKETPLAVEAPPVLEEPIIRLVHTEFGLPELFAARAKENKMKVHWAGAEEIAPAVVGRVKELGITSGMYPVSGILEKLGVGEALKAAGVRMVRWDEGTLDGAYDVEMGLTDAWAAVAETGSIVIKGSAGHGKIISLTPEYHFCVLEPKVFVPDLVDLFEKMGRDNTSSNNIIISGPSKTSDIEMNLVVGVHGPCQVEVFLLK